jgi:N-acetyl-anhydromuramyl-L-alanine amidase AmpD
MRAFPVHFLSRGAAALALSLLGSGCASTRPVPPASPAAVGNFVPRTGDEIVVAGHYVHTGTPVVLWTDPGGYDAYRVERRFSSWDEADWDSTQEKVQALTKPNRYDMRRAGLSTNEIERLRGGGWDLPTLQNVVDQFVLHFDVCGTSRQCFKILHDHRGLSVHFMLDLDGTIYQTLDLKERAWHATTSNHRSVGIEIANMGGYRDAEENPLADWYTKDSDGRTRITIPERFGDGGIRTPNFVGRPARNEPVRGVVQNVELTQYDYTPEQYRALAHLTAALCEALPKIKCDYPRDAQGKLVTEKLPDDVLASYQGVLGHYHIQTNKTDPGPALDWDKLIRDTRALMNPPPQPSPVDTSLGHMRRRN